MAERRLLADLTPLRVSPDYRRLTIGTALSGIGSTMATFAVALQVYVITGSSAAVGGVGLAVALPALIAGPFAGSLIDAVDRRRLVLVTTSALTGASALFAVQAYLGNTHVWVLYGLVAVQSTLGSVNGPARRTFMPRLLPKDQIPAAAALSMMTMHTAMLGGPLLAGLVIPLGGVKVCYVVDAATFLAALYGVARLPAMPPEGATARPGLAAAVAGLRFVTRSRVLTGVLLADVSATVFAMPVALFPALNAERFHGSPRTLGLLGAGLAIGGVVGTVFSGPLGRVQRQGLGVLVAGAAWGAALTGFALVHTLWATMAFLVLAGIADVISVVLRTTIVQVATPDSYRGRVNAVEMMVGANVPQLGNFRAGLVASAFSPAASAGVGGVMAVIGATAIGIGMPAVAHYRADDEVSEAQPARR
ncbi:MAG TPA: MFS transporter [Jatrophihabitans sp.]